MIARRLNRLAVDHVLYEPLGVHLAHHAWPKAVSAIVKARCPCSGASARPRDLRWARFKSVEEIPLLIQLSRFAPRESVVGPILPTSCGAINRQVSGVHRSCRRSRHKGSP
jgi:hypothetical protein